MRYAEGTLVAVDKSKAEIESTLRRFGADQFVSGWSGNKAMIGFTCRGRQIRFTLALPGRDEKRFTLKQRKGSSHTYDRTSAQADQLWEQACRERWRALALVVKAKLAAVESGITDFETEFLAYVMLPHGATVGSTIAPAIEEAYRTGAVPRLIPALPAHRESD